ncbi:MAG: alginate lyase family protein [Proteobacteria bacterium]|nr:alginate lyase family protein [Pseudomonadota bacterium]MBI3497946.1 alginate lyase family protein [Pseudomonadota bacterium]
MDELSKYVGLDVHKERTVVALAASAGQRLAGPYDLAQRHALIGGAIAEASFKDPPAPVPDVIGVSYYSDANASVIDTAKLKANIDALRPFREFVRGVVEDSDRWVAGNPPQPRVAACALDWLDAWAGAGALLGRVNNQGGYERKWSLAALALSYLKLADAGDLDPNKRRRVEAWLADIARRVMPDYQRPSRTDNRNNHAYWAGLAVAAAGAAAGDHGLFDWGIGQYRVFLAEIHPDGTLPLEINRKARALHYHIYALAPLVLLAELGHANGIDLYAESDGAVHRLVGRVAAGLDDPSWFEARTGIRQDVRDKLGANDMAWAEPYYARFGTAALLPHLRHFRPLSDRSLGGNLTLLYGVKDLPAHP